MRLRRAKALPTCENSRKKTGHPLVGGWRIQSFYIHLIWKHPTKKSGVRKNTAKISALKPLPIEDGSMLHFFKKNHNNNKKKMDFERMVSERTWCWNNFPVSCVKPVCSFAETSVEEYKFHLIFPLFFPEWNCRWQFDKWATKIPEIPYFQDISHMNPK